MTKEDDMVFFSTDHNQWWPIVINVSRAWNFDYLFEITVIIILIFVFMISDHWTEDRKIRPQHTLHVLNRI